MVFKKAKSFQSVINLPNENCHISNGWFQNFKLHFKIYKFNIVGEQNSVDPVAADEYRGNIL